jgi:FKBP-type peptidyl-prolyl cis-trans isomerase
MQTTAIGARCARSWASFGFALCALALASACGDAREHEAGAAQAASDPALAAASDTAQGALARSEREGGLVLELQRAGDGRAARAGDRVRFHQRITSADGTREFDSTWASGVPLEARLGHGELIAGLERGLDGLAPGARAKLEVPAALAWGSTGFGSVPADTALVIELELLGVVEAN